MSSCDTSATTVVLKIETKLVDGNITEVTVTLGGTKGGASGMLFLKSSSYKAVFYENSDVKNIQCMTEANYREASMELVIDYFHVGEYAKTGCYYKNDETYWSTKGNLAIVDVPGQL